MTTTLQKIAVGIITLLLLTQCSPDTSSSLRTRSQAPITKTQRTDALSMMEVAFIGGHSRTEIKARMDKVMPLYNLPITEENYERAGSSLVALRKETGVAEIAILQCMSEMHVDGLNMQFPSSAALCATTLSL